METNRAWHRFRDYRFLTGNIPSRLWYLSAFINKAFGCRYPYWNDVNGFISGILYRSYIDKRQESAVWGAE